MKRNTTPASQGYRMPAEWEPHQCTWLSWPHNPQTWPGLVHEATLTMVTAVKALVASEPVRINVRDAAHQEEVSDLLEEAAVDGEVHFHHFPTNDAWIRDHGAIFLRNDSGIAATDWGYNAWGGKYPPWGLDNGIPPRMADALGVPCFQADMILEGGSIDVNGAGVLLTTESCLLNPNRNPDLTREAIEMRLKEGLGVQKVLWLGDGIVGDDTDGHIDDITRFVDPATVVTVIEEDVSDVNYAPLQENLERLKGMSDLQGKPFRIVTLPMPEPVFYEGQRLPASYANFYIANKVVLLPVFGHKNDAKAIGTLQGLFPGRRIVAIDSTFLVWGLGAFHCLTQQVPAVGLSR